MHLSPPDPALPPEADSRFDIGSTEDSLERMIGLFARYGDTYRVFAPGRGSYTCVIHHPDDVKRVLVGNHRNYTKGVGLDRVRILLGKGIMTSEGELWTRQRYMMQPAFHRRVLTRFAGLIAATNRRWLERWAAVAARGEPINVTDEVSELTLEIVLRSIFGDDLEVLTQRFGGNPFELVARDPSRDLRFAYRFRQLGRLVRELVAERRRTQRDEVDLLGLLMAVRDKDTGAGMGENELVDEVMTLIVAGHETTASALNWTWYLLSQHREIDERLAASLRAAPDWAEPSLTESESLHYAQQVVNEALRLYPPGWVLSRRAVGDDVLGGFHVPGGTDVLLPLYLLHRHPRYWREPDRFDPDRFGPEQESDRPRFAYMPFAAGPRHCIGEALALYEMLVHLYVFAREFRLEYSAGPVLELEAQINLRTRNPLHMTLERRR